MAADVVCLHGHCGELGDAWYTIDSDSKELKLVAHLTSTRKFCGWTIIGEDIYAAAQFPGLSTDAAVKILRKHNMRKAEVGEWEDVSGRLEYPYLAPLLVPDDDGKNIYFFGRFSYYDVSDYRAVFGRVYNMVSKSWTKLDVDFKSSGIHSDAAVTGDGDQKAVIFYDSLNWKLFTYHLKENHLKESRLASCYLDLPSDSIDLRANSCPMLHHALRNAARAVERDGTLYWFAHDLYLYGYDIAQCRWFRSESFETVFSSVLEPNQIDTCSPMVLVGLHNGKLMVIHRRRPDYLFAVACFNVFKRVDSLDVCGDTCFTLGGLPYGFNIFDAMAVPSFGVRKMDVSGSRAKGTMEHNEKEAVPKGGAYGGVGSSTDSQSGGGGGYNGYNRVKKRQRSFSATSAEEMI